ncbi:hypothetical protein MTR62_14440 [Novosphingobium sp. 1949]|uniref:Transmembrane protein n=1 Tax=Novosphingobium organovorum TaxID=2930092 RepID=A0ABT0BGJ5_9SPHN|nr:hypothetical protein [Novosphingobium organovorum]MCJ2183884.1 hypothetical protein [Novosphingobium organovorum]
MKPPERDPAAARFFALQLARIGGIALIVLGIVITQGTALPAVPDTIGYALMGAGLIDTLFVPRLLARRWRSRDTE